MIRHDNSNAFAFSPLHKRHFRTLGPFLAEIDIIRPGVYAKSHIFLGLAQFPRIGKAVRCHDRNRIAAVLGIPAFGYEVACFLHINRQPVEPEFDGLGLFYIFENRIPVYHGCKYDLPVILEHVVKIRRLALQGAIKPSIYPCRLPYRFAQIQPRHLNGQVRHAACRIRFAPLRLNHPILQD